jgi:hypothetical protein
LVCWSYISLLLRNRKPEEPNRGGGGQVARVGEGRNAVLAHPAPLDLLEANAVLDAGMKELAKGRIDALEQGSLPGRVVAVRAHVRSRGQPFDPESPIVAEGCPGEPIEGIRRARIEEQVEAQDVDQTGDGGAFAPPHHLVERRLAHCGDGMEQIPHELVEWVGPRRGLTDAGEHDNRHRGAACWAGERAEPSSMSSTRRDGTISGREFAAMILHACLLWLVRPASAVSPDRPGVPDARNVVRHARNRP